MKVAFIGLRGVPATYSGVEVAVEEIGARLVTRGHDVTVFCMADGDNGGRRTYRGLHLRYIPCIRSKHAQMITYSVLATVASLATKFDIVHFQALGPATLS